MTRVRIFIESRLGCFWVDGSMTKPSRTAQFGKTVLYQAVQKDAKSCGMFVLKVWQLFIYEYYAFCTTITVQQKFWRVQ